MIRISQAHVFLKDFLHIHQMRSHFVGGYRLDFSPTGQKNKTSILQAFGPPWFLIVCRRNKIKRSQISQFLIKMFVGVFICLFFNQKRYVEKGIRSAHL